MLMPNTNLGVAAAAAADENFVGSLNSLGVIGTNSVSTTTSSATNNSSNQQQDTTWTKLFVGGLPYHTTDKSLRDHFAVYGEIEEAVVITDRSTGKSRGYGFVTMTDRSAAERACKEPNPMIDGRKANVNLAILGAKPRTSLPTAFPFSGIRAGFPTLLASQYGIPSAGYVYQMPYLTTAAASPTNLVQFPATTLQQAAAVAAATSQFYEYQNAAATAAAVAAAASYPTNYAAAAAAAVNGFEAFPYATIAGTSGYMNPYTYATNLPQATSIANAAAAAAATNSAFTTLPSYQSAAAAAAVQPSSLQESHMQ